MEQEYTIVSGQAVNARGNLPFAFTGLKAPSTYMGQVQQMFANTLHEQPNIIMMPEFFSPFQLQELLKEMLRSNFLKQLPTPDLMMTGSFHVQESLIKGSASSPDRLFNYAQLTNGTGQKLLDVYKMNRFILEADGSRKGALAPFKNTPGEEHNAFNEREIVLLETPIGRAAVFICIDFLSSDVEKILIDRHVDLIFVMTMTPNPMGGKFLRKMQELGERNGSVVFICNSLGKTSTADPAHEQRIVVYLPGFGVFTSPEEWAVLTFAGILTNFRQQQAIRKAALAAVKAAFR